MSRGVCGVGEASTPLRSVVYQQSQSGGSPSACVTRRAQSATPLANQCRRLTKHQPFALLLFAFPAPHCVALFTSTTNERPDRGQYFIISAEVCVVSTTRHADAPHRP